MDSERILFVGFKITDELKKKFVDESSRQRMYMEDPAYLEIMTIDGQQYIGKRTTVGIALDRLEDMARNVVSLMARVTKDWMIPADDALVIAAEQAGLQGEAETDEDAQADGFDYGGLVD